MGEWQVVVVCVHDTYRFSLSRENFASVWNSNHNKIVWWIHLPCPILPFPWRALTTMERRRECGNAIAQTICLAFMPNVELKTFIQVKSVMSNSGNNKCWNAQRRKEENFLLRVVQIWVKSAFLQEKRQSFSFRLVIRCDVESVLYSSAYGQYTFYSLRPSVLYYTHDEATTKQWNSISNGKFPQFSLLSGCGHWPLMCVSSVPFLFNYFVPVSRYGSTCTQAHMLYDMLACVPFHTHIRL